MIMEGTFDSQITFCYTRDLDGTAEFWEEKLGFRTVLDQGGCRIYQVAEKAFIGFCQRVETGTPDGVILTLVTEDVDGWHERLKNLGVPFEKEPALNPDYNIYHCFLRDPNGYLLEIQQFLDPTWLHNSFA